jgi:O-antigen biosynthesis protein
VIRSKLDCTLSFDLVLVDDASPVAELSSLLDYLSSRGLLTLLRNKKNRGFVGSVNNGMKLHSDRDVVLLNSDTEVFGNWLDRLRRAAYSGDDIGTVTPFSNNATICSYPNFPGEFKGALEISFAELDQIAATANAGKTVEIPTAVGFCMYIRRKCLQEVGFFDEAAFGLGYGEENDFSLRATRSGWRNVLAGDVFVRHLGRVSFLDSTEYRVKQGLKLIESRFPSYLADIAAYIRSDPPKALRRNIDAARLRRFTGDRVILFTLHNLGGGTAKHVREISKLLEREDVGALWLQPKTDPDHLAVIRHPKVEHLSNGIEIDLRYGLPQAAQLMRDLAVVHIHVHHILGFSSEFVEWVKHVAELCEIPYDVTIHDYFLACPQITMIDGSGQYCNNYQLEKCESCIQTHSSPVGRVSVWYWRASHEKFLANARRIFVPNESVQRHMAQFFPTLEFSTREHPEAPAQCMFAPVARQPGELLRVAVIGAIGAHKGSMVLQQCAQDAAERRLPIEFHLFGYSDIAQFRALPNIKPTGKYAEKELPQLLAMGKCHLAFFPAVWPETYSYTLSQAWFAGLYPVAFDLGAIADRIRRNGWGHLLPLEMASDPSSLNETLLALRPSPQPADFDPVMGSRLYPTIWHDYYGLPGQV